MTEGELSCTLKECAAVQEVTANVLQNADNALEGLITSAWPQMAASSHAQLQLFIVLLIDIQRNRVLLLLHEHLWPSAP